MNKVIFKLDCALSERRADGIEALCLEADGQLPFVPVPGMKIIPIAGDDYREVDAVLYDAPAMELIVFFKDEEHWTPEGMIKLGWREEP